MNGEQTVKTADKKPLIILTGPTAVGKTALSVRLAKAVNGEIISADSMQVYRHMDIGSAKIREEEKGGVRHYLIDVLNPQEEFNIVTFQKLAGEALSEIYQKGKIPLLVGGTGFYIQSVLYEIDFSVHDETNGIRAALMEEAQTQDGIRRLHERLREVDPASAEKIHSNNVKRVIRALEFYEETGGRISEHNETQHQKASPFAFAYFVLNDEREKIYERINMRVDQMLADGLVEEVEALKTMGCGRNMVSMQGLGYKEILDYLDGQITLEEAVYRIKRDTRHFAKRQITWFKREKDVIWMNRPEFGYDEERMLDAMLAEIKIRCGI